jgi:MoxR-like ATPase
VAGAAEITAFQEAVRRVRVDEALTAYIVSLVRATREEGDFTGGVSTRGALALSRAAQAFAFLGGRDFVTPDDIKRLFVPVTCHRVCTEWDRLEAHARTAEVLDRILTRVPVPR